MLAWTATIMVFVSMKTINEQWTMTSEWTVNNEWAHIVRNFSFSRIRPLRRPEPSGGILADEMGLGKTVEVLACVLLNPRLDLPANTTPPQVNPRVSFFNFSVYIPHRDGVILQIQ